MKCFPGVSPFSPHNGPVNEIYGYNPHYGFIQSELVRG